MNVIWFNGPSARRFLDMPAQTLEIGCNFIERHRQVHHVCAYDRECIQRLPITEGVGYWTRPAMITPQFQLVPNDVKYSCSGTMAIRLACHLGARSIYVIGCDWQHTNDSIYDSSYSWRSGKPRKYTLARRETLVRTAQEIELSLVTDREVSYAGVRTIGTDDFLRLIKN